MAVQSNRSEASLRGAKMLRSALGASIAAWLDDPQVIEVMLNPDGRLWVDRLGIGVSDSGERLASVDGGRIVRLVAHHVGVEVHQASSRVSAASLWRARRWPWRSRSRLMPRVRPCPGKRRAFLTADSERRTVRAEGLTAPASPYVLQAGSIVPAALITGIRSDLPGPISAHVTENVYDSPTGHMLLIPQGARLIGEYDSSVAFGQDRVLLVWNRLILPDGRSMILERQPGADARGFAGLQDKVNQHWGGIAHAALLSTVLGIGSQVGGSGDDALVRAIRLGTADTVSQAGQQIVRRQLNVQPTLDIRPGYPVRLIVTRDLVLAPTPRDR